MLPLSASYFHKTNKGWVPTDDGADYKIHPSDIVEVLKDPSLHIIRGHVYYKFDLAN